MSKRETYSVGRTSSKDGGVFREVSSGKFSSKVMDRGTFSRASAAASKVLSERSAQVLTTTAAERRNDQKK